MAVQQHEEGMRILPLLEYRAVLRKPRRAGFAENVAEFLGAESGKQRQTGNQRGSTVAMVPPWPQRLEPAT
jgi:hypothetical protein